MTYLLAQALETNRTDSFFLVIVAFMFLIFLFRAGLAYPRYKRSIYPHLYENYLVDYFYKMNVFMDPSKSGLMKKLVGYHRLVYANLTDKEGKLCAQIVTLIHGKGLLSLAYINTSGKLSGSDQGSWYVSRNEDGKEKRYKIENPGPYLKEYLKHLAQVSENKKVDSAIAVNDSCDISDVTSAFRIIPYSKIEETVKASDCGYGLNEAEIDALFEKLGGKIDHK